jgi:hypothetical protein
MFKRKGGGGGMACAGPTYLPPLNLPRLLEKTQRLNACAFNPQSGVIQSLHSFREVSMPENQEVLRQALLTDLARSAKISTRPGLLC